MATVHRFDDLIRDSEVWRMLGITSMTGWRWTNDPEYEHLKFPPPIKLGNRNYRSRAALNKWCQHEVNRNRKRNVDRHTSGAEPIRKTARK